MPLDLWTRLDPLRRIRCPFCFERFAACELHLRCNDPYCKKDVARQVDDPILSVAQGGEHGGLLRGPWWTDPLRDSDRGWRRHLDWLILPSAVRCPNCRRLTDYRLCPRCHSHLPDSAIELPSGHIAIFGPQSVGKTTYVTVLLHELDHRVGPERRFTLSPLTDEIRDRYESEYHSVTYGSMDLIEENGQAPERWSHQATAPMEVNRGILRPLIYRLTRRQDRRRSSVLLSFFDTAGEDWERNIELLRSEANYLRQARGLLFLIDPLRIPQVKNALRASLTEKERVVPPANYLDDARKLATFFPKLPVKTPLAIVLNKLDRWGTTLSPGTTLHQIARGIPDGQPVNKSLDRTIHEEVRASLDRWGAVGFLEHVEIHFPNHQFFACSSLGDAAQDRADAPQPLPTPLLVERPVLWLLEKQGILRD